MRGHVVLLVWLLMVGPLSATTYHVGKSGNNSVTCANADYAPDATQAKLTVAAGLGCATAPGDVVMIHAGTYVENPTMTSSGSSGNPIIIQSFPEDSRDTVIVQGNMVISAASWVTLQGFSVTQQSVTIIGNSSHIDILNMRVFNAPQYAFNINSSGGATISDVLVENCEATGNGSTGVRGSPDITSGPYFIAKFNITVRNCLIYDNGEDGIALSNVDGVLLENNTIYNQVEDGMDMKQGTKNVVIRYNTIYDNTNAGIMINPVHSSEAPPFTGGQDFVIEGNTIYNNGNKAGSADGDSQIRINSAGVPTGRSRISNNVLIGSTRAVTDGISLFRAIKVDVFNNTIRNVTRFGILGRCYRDGSLMNNIIDGQDRTFSAEGSSADCTGYANGLITEDYNLLRTTGSSLIRWTTGTAYATLALYQAGTGQGAHSLSVDPQFTSTTNSTLLATSPAIDHGLCLTDIPTDRMGIARPFGSACDMGAYEFVSGVPPAPLPGIVLLPAPTQVGAIRQGGALQGGTRR